MSSSKCTFIVYLLMSAYSLFSVRRLQISFLRHLLKDKRYKYLVANIV